MLYVHTENGVSYTSYCNAAPALRLMHVHSGNTYHLLCVLPRFMSMPQSPWMPAHPQREAAVGSCGLVGLEGHGRREVSRLTQRQPQMPTLQCLVFYQGAHVCRFLWEADLTVD